MKWIFASWSELNYRPVKRAYANTGATTLKTHTVHHHTHTHCTHTLTVHLLSLFGWFIKLWIIFFYIKIKSNNKKTTVCIKKILLNHCFITLFKSTLDFMIIKHISHPNSHHHTAKNIICYFYYYLNYKAFKHGGSIYFS